MQGQYKTPKGELMQIEIFDAENKMVYVQIPNGQHKWFIQSDYKDWVSTEPEEDEGAKVFIDETEIVEEPEEIKIKKPTPKKNAKTHKK